MRRLGHIVAVVAIGWFAGNWKMALLILMVLWVAESTYDAFLRQQAELDRIEQECDERTEQQARWREEYEDDFGMEALGKRGSL